MGFVKLVELAVSEYCGVWASLIPLLSLYCLSLFAPTASATVPVGWLQCLWSKPPQECLFHKLLDLSVLLADS